ncbi:hypothetical protein RUND412_011164, partial [Rhizina undulata]
MDTLTLETSARTHLHLQILVRMKKKEDIMIPKIVIDESSGNTTHLSKQKRAIRSLSFSFIDNKKKDSFDNRPQRRKSTDSLEARDHLPKTPEKSFLNRALALGKSETEQKKKEAKKAKAADKLGEASITAKDSTAISGHHEYKATYMSHGENVFIANTNIDYAGTDAGIGNDAAIGNDVGNEKEAGNGDNPEFENHTSPRAPVHTVTDLKGRYRI